MFYAWGFSLPEWEVLDRALERLDGSAFSDRWYAVNFRGRIAAELERIFIWYDGSNGGVELYPSKEVRALCGVVMELRGAEAVEDGDVVREAWLVLEGQRDGCGRIPAVALNNYFTLKHCLDFGGDCGYPVTALARHILAI